MSQQLIREGLDGRLKAWADSKRIPVAWQNIRFDPPASRYLQVFLLPNETRSDSLDKRHRSYQGLYQVMIVEPVNQDPRQTDALVDELERLFSPSTPIDAQGLCIHILQPMSAAPAIQAAERYFVPVTVPYRIDVRINN